MAFVSLLEIFLAVLCFSILRYFNNRNEHLKNWLLLGMLPDLLLNIHRVYDWMTDLAERSGGTYHFKGPWFCNMDLLGTVDPANVQHIMCTNFSNYPKGTMSQKMMDIFGDGLFSADLDSWKFQRKIANSLITGRQFYQFLVRITKAKVEEGLIPVLDHFSKQGLAVDMQRLTHRFTIDINFTLITGNDPETLSIEFPEDQFFKAIDDAEKVVFYRHATPEILWKLQKLMGFGVEPKMKKAWDAIDERIAKLVSRKRGELGKGKVLIQDGEFVDVLTSYISMEGETFLGSRPYNKFLRDTIFNFLIAGRENSLAWLFWFVARNPQVEAKIREELRSIIPPKEADQWRVFGVEELKNLVYLHAAIYETLRFYPAIPIQQRAPLKPDILPSGHCVNPKMRIITSSYVMGRMKCLWGDDCLEFKPERWISERGHMKHVPSNKNVSFNAGPRTCIGKNIALVQMKVMAAAVIHNYHVRVVEGHPVVPTSNSIVLHMKHGLMVRITRRWD